MNSQVSTRAEDLRIRRLRGPKPSVDPWTAHGSLIEDERRPNGHMERALTMFLAGAECAFTCAFCDLWRYTLDGPTPTGALPKQIADTLHRHGEAHSGEGPVSSWIDRVKLYNASNFFDPRAVPLEDVPRIAELCAPFAGVTVETHARTVGDRTLEFARQLRGRLEVAMGLETIHDASVARLNKRLNLERFDRAASFLTAHDVDLRVFVLLGAPGIPTEESVEWAVRSADHARQRGATVVAIIPVRGGNGEMERLAKDGLFYPPTLRQLEAALDHCGSWTDVVVTADLWDGERLPACPHCRDARVARMQRINATGRSEPPIACGDCDA